MISVWGISFGVLSPLVLLAVPPVLGILVYAYLRRGRAKQVLVSSVVIFKNLKRKSFSRKNFVPPFRFFFELALLLLLLMGAAGLYHLGAGKRIALVMDNSFSMAAKPNAGASAELIELAKDAATEFVSGLDYNSQIEVFGIGPELKSLTSGLVSSSDAVNAISNLQIAYSEDNLSEVLTKFAADSRYNKIVVFTDKLVSATSQLSERFAIQSVRPQNAEMSNFALSRASLKQTESQNEVDATISSYAANQAELSLEIEGLQNEEDNSWVRLGAKSVKLDPLKSINLSMAGLDPKYLAYHLRLNLSGRGADSLSLDNEAWLSTRNLSQKVLLVGDLPPNDLGLRAISSLEFSYLKPEDFEANRTRLNFSSIRTVIFHRYVPSSVPEVNSLFVMPPSNQFFKVSDRISDLELTNWESSNSVLNYVNLSELKLKEGTVLSVPFWGNSILESGQGSVAFLGEYQAKRYLAFGFELFPFEGKNSPSISILTLNALKWLTMLSTNPGFVSANSVVLGMGALKSAQYLLPAELRGQSILNRSGGPDFKTPGLTRLIEKDGSGKEILAVNFFSETESDVRDPRSLRLPDTQAAGEVLVGKESKSRLLAWLAIILLSLDLLWPLLKPSAGVST